MKKDPKSIEARFEELRAELDANDQERTMAQKNEWLSRLPQYTLGYFR